MDTLVVVSKECEVLIEELGHELSAVKDQLAQLTHSLGEDIVIRPPPPHRIRTKTPRPSKCVPLPTIPAPRPKDVPVWSEPVVSITPELPTPPSPPPPQPSSTGKRKRKSPKTNTPPTIDVTPSPETTRHLLQVVDEREALRAEARERYLQLMRMHIEKQLEAFAEKEKLLKKKREKRERQQKAAKLKLKPVRHRSSGEDNKGYLETVYQSYLYKIIGVEHALRQCGKLQTIAELKDFWDQVLSPLHTPAPQTQRRPSPLSFVEEKELQKLEEEGYTNSWAVTAHNPEPDNKAGDDRLDSVCPSTVPTPLKFTPCRLPDLKPIKEILDKNSEESMLKIRKSLKEYEGVIGKQRVRMQRVYQRAKANEMAMRTLLPNEATIECPCFVLSEQSGLGLPSEAPSPPTSHHTKEKPHLSLVFPPLVHHDGHVTLITQADQTNPKEENLGKRRDSKSHFVQPNETPGTNQDTHPLSQKMTVSKESGLSVSTLKPPSKPLCAPLTMIQLLHTVPTKEPKAKSSMWTNYEIAGK